MVASLLRWTYRQTSAMLACLCLQPPAGETRGSLWKVMGGMAVGGGGVWVGLEMEEVGGWAVRLATSLLTLISGAASLPSSAAPAVTVAQVRLIDKGRGQSDSAPASCLLLLVIM